MGSPLARIAGPRSTVRLGDSTDSTEGCATLANAWAPTATFGVFEDDGLVTIETAPTASGVNLIVDRSGDAPFDPLERYERIRTLGEGGMGEVVLCRDRQIGRAVAMKVAHPEFDAAPDRRDRFLREARIQGQLEHPAIVPVYDLERCGDGQPFFTMKRVQGQTLEDLLDLLRRDDDAVREYTRHKLLSVFTQVCLAIDFAHSRGVVHRDLKPGNLMLGRFGEVYVLDWGLAKRLEADDCIPGEWLESDIMIGSDSHTTVGIIGTPAYMAPEQIDEGRTDLVGPRADVYALGAILFEILTLETLHGSDSPVRMLQRALAGVEARPSRRAPERRVPPELEAICVRATARYPEDRYGSARELADAIEAHLAGDRDLELRRELAKRHLASARRATAGAFADEGDRTEALREAGRAIALSPDDDDALRLLVDLLTTPPQCPPAEVVDEVERTRIASLGPLRLFAAMCYGGIGLVLGVLAFVLGLSDARSATIFSLACVVAGGVAYYGASRKDGSAFRLFTVSGAVVAALSSLLGVLTLLPALTAVNAMGQMFTTPRSNRFFVVSMNGAALIVPSALFLVGVHPNQSSSPTPGALVLTTIVGAAILLTATRFAARCRDDLVVAQTRNALQAWQLRRLVPDRASDTSAGLPT